MHSPETTPAGSATTGACIFSSRFLFIVAVLLQSFSPLVNFAAPAILAGALCNLSWHLLFHKSVTRRRKFHFALFLLKSGFIMLEACTWHTSKHRFSFPRTQNFNSQRPRSAGELCQKVGATPRGNFLPRAARTAGDSFDEN
jgi:hypothetical protein